MNIKFPTWKVRGNPTPNDTLYICDNCGDSYWAMIRQGIVHTCNNCRGRKGGYVRMRKATDKETKLGISVLREII